MAETAQKADDGLTKNTATPTPSTEPLPEKRAEQAPAQGQTEAKQTVAESPAESSSAAASKPAEKATVSSESKTKDDPTPADESRDGDSLSIEPSELPPPAVTTNEATTPVCTITLLLPNGARHPYRIDEKYLAKRNVDVPEVTEAGGRDPFSISVYKLKELILREWREEWEGKPASPSSIRLIHFGKLLDDKEQVKKYQFSQDSPNVVHMSVRPPEMMEEEETGKAKSTRGESRRGREGGGGCCVIL
ncbi:hypothetical protein N0V88_004958 [Collariella sp. IMI 366227]|nr:hypothetical protein N0V88_004958 [Collariella sp. IMI 366227]